MSEFLLENKQLTSYCHVLQGLPQASLWGAQACRVRLWRESGTATGKHSPSSWSRDLVRAPWRQASAQGASGFVHKHSHASALQSWQCVPTACSWKDSFFPRLHHQWCCSLATSHHGGSLAQLAEDQGLFPGSFASSKAGLLTLLPVTAFRLCPHPWETWIWIPKGTYPMWWSAWLLW